MSSLHCLEKVSVHVHAVFMCDFMLSEHLLMDLVSSEQRRCLLIDLVMSKQCRFLLMALIFSKQNRCLLTSLHV